MTNLNKLKQGEVAINVKLTDKKIITTTIEKTKHDEIFMKTKQRTLHRRQNNG